MTARPVVTSGLDYDPVLACRHLSDADPMLGALIARVGPCLLRPRQTQSLFAAVARAIVYQQLSGSAAATILGRVKAIYAPKRFPTPRDILATPAGAAPRRRALHREDGGAPRPRGAKPGRHRADECAGCDSWATRK